MRRILIIFLPYFLPSFTGSGVKSVQDQKKKRSKRHARKARKHLPIHNNNNNNSGKAGISTPLLVDMCCGS
jgi:hypothetical protein